MCSIIAYEGRDISLQQLDEAFSRSYMRGPDARCIQTLAGGYIGFNRLAIMGLSSLGMQPFSLKGNQVVCNGEIFGLKCSCHCTKSTAWICSACSMPNLP